LRKKANSNIHMLRLMREQGVVVDAVSRGEILMRALAAASGALDGQRHP
jgi:diaminopimelate decarboxylase